MAASHDVYNSVNSPVVSEIEELVGKARAGTITASERKRLGSLNDLRKILDDYAAAHNLFVEAVKTWERTGQEPNNVVLFENQLLQLMNRALDLAKELGLPTAGLR